MKVTKHNFLAVACATLLLTLMFAPASGNTRQQQPLRVTGARHEVPPPAGYKHAGRMRYAQNEAGGNDRDNDRKKSKRSSGSKSSAAANDGNDDAYNNRQKDARTPRSSDSQSEAPTVSRSEAAAIAERATGGRVLSVRESGRYWQVKVLVDDQRVRVVSVDMRSGRVR